MDSTIRGTLGSFGTKTKHTLAKILKRRSRYDFLILISILLYGIVFSSFTIAKHNGFASFAWDLGIFDQISFTSVFNGKLLYTTTELYMNPSGCYFGIHFSPIMFVLLPFYALYPSAIALLVMQSLILALGALPLYLLSSNLMRSQKAGFVIGVLYLLYPAVQASNWFDFHLQAFIPVLIFSMCYFLLKKNWKPYFVFLLLALMIEEHVAPIIFLLGAYFLFTSIGVRGIASSIRHPHFRLSTTSKALIATLAIPILWYFAARWVRSLFPIAPDFWDLYRASDTFGVLGFQGDILTLPVYVLLNPLRTVQALLTDYYFKFFYFIFLFAPLLFCSFRSKLSLVAIILLVPFVLTNYRPYYMLGAQYPLHIVPLVFLAAVEGYSHRKIVGKDSFAQKPASRPEMNTSSHNVSLRLMIVVSLVFIVLLSPVSPIAYTLTKETPILWYAVPSSNEREVDLMHRMIQLVPSNASILTQNTIFPHVSNRMNAYVVPVIDPPSVHEVLIGYIRQQINETDYVLLDLNAYDIWKPFVLDEMVNDRRFGVYAVANSVVLFKRGYQGPVVFVPNVSNEVFSAYRDLNIGSGQIVPDETSITGYVVLSQKGVNSGTLVYGPYVSLPSGTYSVTFKVRVNESDGGRIATFDISDAYGGVILAKKDLFNSDLPTDQWTNLTIIFSTSVFRSNLEFRAFTSGLANVYIDEVIVESSKSS